jgi:hypothetical protein
MLLRDKNWPSVSSSTVSIRRLMGHEGKDPRVTYFKSDGGERSGLFFDYRIEVFIS